MVKMNATDTFAVNISKDEALSFIEKHHSRGWGNPGKSIQCCGLKTANNELVAVAIFCNPRSKDLQKKYTTELYRICFQKDEEIVDGTVKLINYYMQSPLSVDLFAYSNVSENTYDILTASNMMRVINPNTNEEIYEWLNPDVSFYLYKISSKIDDGYYYGRHIIRGKNITINDCLKDKYYGSGGLAEHNKFKMWFQKQSKENIVKEIIEIVPSWHQAIDGEVLLIKDLYKTDINCKNTMPGGTGYTYSRIEYKETACLNRKSDHYKLPTMHLGKSCAKCTSQKSISYKECKNSKSPHFNSLTVHQGSSCMSCKTKSFIVEKRCLTDKKHGVTLHANNSCYTCIAEATYNKFSCKNSESGHFNSLTTHKGKTCWQCVMDRVFKLKPCQNENSDHYLQETKHIGDSCRKCSVTKTVNIQECSNEDSNHYGQMTTHQGNTCSSCVADRVIVTRFCKDCNEKTKLIGDSCFSCVAKTTYSQRKCENKDSNHYNTFTSHKGDTCMSCALANKTVLGNCSNDASHVNVLVHVRNSVCIACAALKAFTEEECKDKEKNHGITPHQGGKCSRCIGELKFTEKECKVHGLVKFKKNLCMTCNAEAKRGNCNACGAKGNFYLHKCIDCKRKKRLVI